MMSQTRQWRGKLAEGVLIVASILLAFWIDAWWDRLEGRRAEAETLVVVSREVSSNLSSLQMTLEDTDAILARLDEFFSATPSALLQVPRDSVRNWTRALHSAPTFNPMIEASLRLVQTPVAELETLKARDLVSRWLRGLDDANEELTRLRQRQDVVWYRLAAYAARSRSEGTELLPDMVARLGPEGLVEISADEQLMAAVVDKGTFQRVYLRELQAALALLDSVDVELRKRSQR